jgi:peptide deformylase
VPARAAPFSHQGGNAKSSATGGAFIGRGIEKPKRFGREDSEAFAIHTLTEKLAGAANGLSLLAGALFRRLLIAATKLHLAENAFALHLLLERAQRLIDIVVADQNVDDGSYSRCWALFLEKRVECAPGVDELNSVTRSLINCELDARSTTTSLNLKGLADMSLLPVMRMGDPVLRSIAAPIADPTDPAIGILAESMMETMIDAPGVGLAAPQIGSSLRLIVMRLIGDRSEVDEPPRMMALVNPEFEPIGTGIELGWEGCLSVPELRGVVPRHARIAYRGWLPDGTRVESEAEGFQARILQHEIDHLDGILYLDRMQDFSTLGYGPEIQAAAEAAQRSDAKL